MLPLSSIQQADVDTQIVMVLSAAALLVDCCQNGPPPLCSVYLWIVVDDVNHWWMCLKPPDTGPRDLLSNARPDSCHGPGWGGGGGFLSPHHRALPFFLQDMGTALLLVRHCLWGFASLPPPLPCGLPAPADNFGVQHDDWANNHSCITHVATGDVARGKKRSASMIVAVIGDLGLIKLGMQCLVNIADLIFALYNWGVVFIIGC